MTDPAEIAKGRREYYGCCVSWRWVGHTPRCKYHPDNRRTALKEMNNGTA